MNGRATDRHQVAELAIALRELEKRIDERDAFRQAALDASERRLDKADAGFRALHDTLDAELRPIRDRLEIVSRPNWTLLTSFLSIALVVIAGTYTIIGLRIDTAITPNSTAIVALQEHNRQLDTEVALIGNHSTESTQDNLLSRGDRSQLNARITVAEQALAAVSADRRVAEATTKAALVEIETQFKATSIAINLEKDSTQQIMALLWAKVYNEPLPPTKYRPSYYRE